MKTLARTIPFLLAALLLGAQAAHAQEAQIRKTLGERIPQLAQIDEVSTTPMKGLYEIRLGTDVYYTDASGNFLIQGELIDTGARRNLTEDRVNKLTAIDFKSLPLQDAFKVVHGKGERQLVVFEDPNCGYCKRFEKDMQKVDNVTLHVFLYPILSADSAEKSRNIWCAKDPAAVWQDHMLRDVAPPAASCDVGALQRNLALGRKHKITGTPTLIFPDGSRVPGAIAGAEVDQRLNALASTK
ncbi:DsbC family protein [Comamonas flocculans]|uniref:Thiol:disulfide interchange protein n=1 Tax=Comamonas flocculans TaxID=2597701 RepID=A0A5B8RUG6_9BURK|nr:DsbC family protein [Comamonas flocculans]QEA12382.1 DsbC family protein [Comamonas flocculans]